MVRRINIGRSKTGLAVLDVGGGAYTSTGVARFVLNSRRTLKPALYIRSKGQLSCEPNQAVVAVEGGDIIVDIKHKRDVSAEAWMAGDIAIQAYRIQGFDANEAIVQELHEPSYNLIPESVKIGSNTYHNRDGRYFVKETNVK